jgi:hypothetical protein
VSMIRRQSSSKVLRKLGRILLGGQMFGLRYSGNVLGGSSAVNIAHDSVEST